MKGKNFQNKSKKLQKNFLQACGENRNIEEKGTFLTFSGIPVQWK